MARFLVVDDDASTVRAMTRLLSDDGHVVAPFTAGADAIAAMKREPFDVVVTDLEMPHVDGHKVVRAAREHLPDACLIVTSTRAKEHEATLTGAGACLVAGKPFDYDAITKAVGECRARGGGGPGHARCQLRVPTIRPTPLRRK